VKTQWRRWDDDAADLVVLDPFEHAALVHVPVVHDLADVAHRGAGDIVIGGFFGGFVLSAVKRDLGVKDWSRMIEGHTGILDRMDSVSFAAPLFFHLMRYYFAT
jgi:predicted CDP-diglyceride synthetase/phosphatidate cytidylyltransferase